MTSKRTITVERATPADRLYLDMGGFDCLAVLTNQAFNADGILFEYTVSHYHPEYFRFQGHGQPPRQESRVTHLPWHHGSKTKEPLHLEQPGSFLICVLPVCAVYWTCRGGFAPHSKTKGGPVP